MSQYPTPQDIEKLLIEVRQNERRRCLQIVAEIRTTQEELVERFKLPASDPIIALCRYLESEIAKGPTEVIE